MVRLKSWASVAAALSLVPTALFAQPTTTPQAGVANAFLTALDRGDAARAAQLLHPSIKGRIDPPRLIGTAQRRSFYNTRRLTYEGKLSSRFGKSDQMVQRMATTTGYVVCYVEVPRAPNGSISYVSVVLLPAYAADGWQVSNYRVQPFRSTDCPI